MPTDWISTEEAAELSGYHPEYIRRLVRRGKIEAARKGAMFWISRASLIAFLKENKKAKAKDSRYGPKPHKT